MTAKYNFIYEKLVTADDDVLGLIAYGIYKQHKIEFITKIKEDQHREPTQEECNTFFAASTTDSQLNNYRSQAETLLSETVGNIAKEELKHHEDEMLRNYQKEIKGCIPGNWTNFSLSVVAGVVSTILFSVIAGLWLSRKKVGIILLIHKNFFPLPYGRKFSISVSRISAP